MVAHSSFDTIYERLYPPHLRLTSFDQESETDKHIALRNHFHNLAQTLNDLVDAMDELFPGTDRQKAIDLFHEDLLNIAEKLICSNSAILSIAAVNIASQVVCNSDKVGRTTEIFLRFQEQYEARLNEFEELLASDDDVTSIARAIEQGIGFKTINEKWSDFMSETVASFLQTASIIPLSAANADNFHQMAIGQLTELAHLDLPTYENIVRGCRDLCLEPQNYPAGTKIIEQSYRSVIMNSEEAIKKMRKRGGLEKALALTNEYVWLAAGMLLTFHSVPTLKMQAISAFCLHRNRLEKLYPKAAYDLLCELSDYFSRTIKDETFYPALETLFKLTPGQPIVSSPSWVVTGNHKSDDRNPRASIMLQFKKIRRDPLSYTH